MRNNSFIHISQVSNNVQVGKIVLVNKPLWQEPACACIEIYLTEGYYTMFTNSYVWRPADNLIVKYSFSEYKQFPVRIRLTVFVNVL